MKRKRQTSNSSDFCITQFPDDIIVNIFSRLTLQEAARTSLVSKKWRYLWTSYTPNLLFDSTEPMQTIKAKTISEWNTKADKSASEYVTWVNRVLDQSHTSEFINHFRIAFDLCNKHTPDITHWIHTALTKQVQVLELDFRPITFAYYPSHELDFPIDYYNQFLNTSKIPSLRNLCLYKININQQVVEFFIYNCPNLELLTVSGSKTLSRLKIKSSSIPLKYLEIDDCDVNKISISAPGLLSFKYYGRDTMMVIDDVGSLVNLSIGCSKHVLLKNVLNPFGRYFSQLESLYLSFDFQVQDDTVFSHVTLPKLRNLTIHPTFMYEISHLVPILQACPFLYKLTLEMDFSNYCQKPDLDQLLFQHVKVLEVVFDGPLLHESDSDLVSFLVEKAPVLEKVVVNCNLDGCENLRCEEGLKTSVKSLNIPEQVDVMILQSS